MRIFNLNKNLINYRNLEKTDTWLYSAGFNINKNDKNLSRIEEEIFDLKSLIKNNSTVFLLTHQGDFKKKTSKHLFFLKKILEKKIKNKIFYYSGKINEKNMKILSKKFKPKSIIIVGNTRLLKGEQLNSKKLAKIYSLLSNKIVIGGFSKSHRKNSSNNAILEFTNGYLSHGITREIQKLNQWKEFSKKNFLIILGGIKKEKVEIGLIHLSKNFKFILPSGILLNTILKKIGFKIGKSEIFKGKTNQLIDNFLKEFQSKLILPEKIIVIDELARKKKIILIKDVQINDKICGFLMPENLKKLIINSSSNDKILLSGTPSFVEKDIFEPTNTLSKCFKNMRERLLILGGDSANDLNLKNCIVSSGGGAALYYLAFNKLPILDKLNKTKNKL